jgi:hypothetical protein
VLTNGHVTVGVFKITRVEINVDDLGSWEFDLTSHVKPDALGINSTGTDQGALKFGHTHVDSGIANGATHSVGATFCPASVTGVRIGGAGFSDSGASGSPGIRNTHDGNSVVVLGLNDSAVSGGVTLKHGFFVGFTTTS